MTRTRRPFSRAFTLVELLAAMALSTLLVLAILAVIPSIGRARKQIADANTAGRTLDRVFDLIRWDLAQARRVNLQPDQLVLSGYGSLDPGTLEPNQRPARVVYRVRLRGREPWLVREQTSLDVRSNRNVDVAPVELLASARFAARSNPAGAAAASRPTTPRSIPDVFGLADGAIAPDAIEVCLQPAEAGGPAVTKTLYAR